MLKIFCKDIVYSEIIANFALTKFQNEINSLRNRS